MLRKLLINCYQRQREEGERGRGATLRPKSDKATVGASGDAGVVQEYEEGTKYRVEVEREEEKMEGSDDKVAEIDEETMKKTLEEILTVEEIEIATTEEAIWKLLEEYGPE